MNVLNNLYNNENNERKKMLAKLESEYKICQKDITNIVIALEFEKEEIGKKIIRYSDITLWTIAILTTLSLFVSIKIFGYKPNNKIEVIVLVGVLYTLGGYIYRILLRKYRYNIYEIFFNNNIKFLVFYENPLLKLQIYTKQENEFILDKEYIQFDNYLISSLEDRTSINILDSEKRILKNYEILGKNVGDYYNRAMNIFSLPGSSSTDVNPYWTQKQLLEYYKQHGSNIAYIDIEYIKKMTKEK